MDRTVPFLTLFKTDGADKAKHGKARPCRVSNYDSTGKSEENTVDALHHGDRESGWLSPWFAENFFFEVAQSLFVASVPKLCLD